MDTHTHTLKHRSHSPSPHCRPPRLALAQSVPTALSLSFLPVLTDTVPRSQPCPFKPYSCQQHTCPFLYPLSLGQMRAVQTLNYSICMYSCLEWFSACLPNPRVWEIRSDHINMMWCNRIPKAKCKRQTTSALKIIQERKVWTQIFSTNYFLLANIRDFLFNW